MTDWGERSRGGGEGPDLSALRSRLDALHRSVDELGRRDTGGPPAPPPPHEAHGPPGYAAGAAPNPLPPTAYQPTATPSPPPYPAPEAQPPSPGAPYDHAAQPAHADPYAPPPAATNGGGEVGAEAIVPAANVTILDVGPFLDLVELRMFEEAVARLETVRDVHVRRFGHNRAKIEVGMLGSEPVGRELYRLGRPLEVEPGPDGEVIVDFTEIAASESEATEATERVAAAPPATAMPTGEATADASEEARPEKTAAETESEDKP